VSEPIASPAQLAPIDPKHPVRGLGEWLNFLHCMVAGYTEARHYVSSILIFECETAPAAELFGPGGDEDYDPMHPVTKLVAGKLRSYCAAKVRAKVEKEALPWLTNMANAVLKCIPYVTPFIDGIHAHLGALDKDPGQWEKGLAMTLRKLNTFVASDRFFVEKETFTEPSFYQQRRNSAENELSTFLNDIGAKVDDLATVALPVKHALAETGPGAGNVAPVDTKEQPWVDNPDDAPDFLSLTEARKLIDDRLTLSALSKKMRHDGKIHYMKKPGYGCRAHIGDFLRYFKSRPNDPEYVKIVASFIANEGKGDVRFCWKCQDCGGAVKKTADRCPNRACAGHQPASFNPKIERVIPPEPRR
jgi:hypothetical protein